MNKCRLSVSTIVLCGLFLPVFLFGEEGGGLKFAAPPLGYPEYSNEKTEKHNRLTLSYLRYDSEDFNLYGSSLNMHTRLFNGNRGSFSLKYGAFFVTGQERDSLWTWDASAGAWVSEGDTDLTVGGVSFQPQLEWQALNYQKTSGWGFRLIPFISLDTEFQFFNQEMEENPYYSLLLGSSPGVQALIRIPGNLTFSPFFQLIYMHVFSFDDGTKHYNSILLNYGFDIIWKNYSLSGIIQPLLNGKSSFTISIGIGF